MKTCKVWQAGLGPGLLGVAGDRAAQATKLPQGPCAIQDTIPGPVSATPRVLVNHRAVLVIVELSPLGFENINPKLKLITILLWIK